MALLGALSRAGFRRRSRRHLGTLLGVTALFSSQMLSASTPGFEPREYQIKAVFLFNFAQFVEWPETAFADAHSPLVVAILGENPFGNALDETIHGERLNGRSLTVIRSTRVEDILTCHILFVSRSEAGRLDEILSALKGRSILTVSDIEGFSRQGGMIQFVTENNKVRLRINNDAARSAGLTISSKLLRPSQAAFLWRRTP
jgi:hypothetical protein